MIIKKGDYEIIEDIREEEFEQTDTPEYTGGDDFGATTSSDIKGKQIKGTAQELKTSKSAKTVLGKRKIDWKQVANSTIPNSTIMSQIKKQRILKTVNDTSIINWQKELKKYIDSISYKTRTSYPNKRTMYSEPKGGELYTLKRRKTTAQKGYKTFVAVLDTSSSISHDQARTFLIEVVNLIKVQDIKFFVIIWCSDTIDHWQVLPTFRLKGAKLEAAISEGIEKWPTTGGNANGFLPPFELLQTPKRYRSKTSTPEKVLRELRLQQGGDSIIPSVLVYLTDTKAAMPSLDSYNIKSYADKVIWFAVVDSPDKVPFGRILHVPVRALKEKKTKK